MLVFINGQHIDNPTENKEFLELLENLPLPGAFKDLFSNNAKEEESGDLFQAKAESFVKEDEFKPGFVDTPVLEEGFDKMLQEEEGPVCSGNPLNCEKCGESLLNDFSDALDALKEGYTVTRKSWLEQDKTRFLYFVGPNVYPAKTNIAQKVFGDEVPYSGYIALKTDAGYVTPYTPTTPDLLSEDWLILND